MLNRQQVLLVDLEDLLDARAECLQVDALQCFLFRVLLVVLVALTAARGAVDITFAALVVRLVVFFVRKLEGQFGTYAAKFAQELLDHLVVGA